MSKRDKPTHEGVGFGSLAGFRASKESYLEVHPKSNEAEGEIAAKVLVQKNLDNVKLVDNEAQEAGNEDFKIVSRIVTLVNQNTLKIFKNDSKNANRHLLALNHGDTKKYNAIVRLVTGSRLRDVSYEIGRWLKSDCEIKEIDDICKSLLLKGYKSEALSWIRSLGVEQMKYGSIPGNSKPTPAEKRKYRIEQAEIFAAKAATTIQALSEEHNLSSLLAT